MRRREFVAGLAGAAAWASGGQAQLEERVRRIGVLVPLAREDPEAEARLSAFIRELQTFGWMDGINVRIDTRWGAGNSEQYRRYSAELIEANPDVILAIGGASAVLPLLQATQSIPIIFTAVIDPVGAGIVETLGRPGGNATGFMQFEYNLSGKWVELLKQIAPGLKRVAVIRDPNLPSSIGQFAIIQSVAPSLGIEISAINMRDSSMLERRIASLADTPNTGLIVTSSAFVINRRDLLISAANRHQLPAIYPYRFFAQAGGLISYGPDLIEPHRRAAAYVHRILIGERAAELPVLAPTKYELALNRRTATSLGIVIAESLLARADEVIE